LLEQLTQAQETLRAHYKQAANLAAEQQQLITDLRTENEALRAKLASNPTQLAWEAESLGGQDVAKQGGEVSWRPKDAISKSAETMCPQSEEQAASEQMRRKSDPGQPKTAPDNCQKQPAAKNGTEADGVTLPGEVAGAAVECLQGGEDYTIPKPSVNFAGTIGDSIDDARDGYTAILPDARLSDNPRGEPGLDAQVVKLANFFSRKSIAVDGSQGKGSAKAVFADAATMKERVRQAIFKPEYHVSNYYKTHGFCQWVARSAPFDHITLAVIAFNAIWIAIDSDNNTEPVIMRAHAIFQIAEHGFCLYFSGEWLIRFGAFEDKRNCVRDPWFIFDTCLVGLMVLESWVMASIIMLTGNGGNSGMGSVSVLKILRLLRLTRMARMAKLLRAMPELMILIKGISGAARSVFFTLLLLTGIIYIFAIAFRTLTDGSGVGSKYFSSVPSAMATLLLGGTLPDMESLVNEVGAEHFLYGALLLCFILLASLTVMNMLVGVLVEVVCTVSSVEKEQMEASFLKGHMMNLLKGLDEDGNVRISRQEFGQLLEKPKAIKALQEVGVDVVGLADLSDFIYKDRHELSFPDFMEMVLQLRGTNTATVKSIVDVRMFMTKELARVEDTLLEKLHQIISVDLCHVICGVMTGDSEGLRKSLIALSSSAKIPLGSGNRSSGIELGSAGEGHLA